MCLPLGSSAVLPGLHSTAAGAGADHFAFTRPPVNSPSVPPPASARARARMRARARTFPYLARPSTVASIRPPAYNPPPPPRRGRGRTRARASFVLTPSPVNPFPPSCRGCGPRPPSPATAGALPPSASPQARAWMRARARTSPLALLATHCRLHFARRRTPPPSPTPSARRGRGRTGVGAGAGRPGCCPPSFSLDNPPPPPPPRGGGGG